MDENPVDLSPADPKLFAFFSFLGAVSAVMVGIGIFDGASLQTPANRSPSSVEASPAELRMDLPVLE